MSITRSFFLLLIIVQAAAATVIRLEKSFPAKHPVSFLRAFDDSRLQAAVDIPILNDTGLLNSNTVADLIEENQWKWPDSWYDLFPDITTINVPYLINDKDDECKWRSSDGNEDIFSIKKHAFVLWLAVMGRLSTQDRLMRWNNQLMMCPLCMRCNDSHSHLFFNREYSNKIWKRLLIKLKLRSKATDWNSIIKEIGETHCNNSIGSVVRRICLGAVVYNIWKERNNRIFTSEEMSVDCLFKVIVTGIKIHLMSLQVKDTAATRRIAEEWDVKFNKCRNLSFKECLA
ncbi:reverse transcriptase zinc-binding domain-containing protein [Tanacetum coccineum]